MVVPASITAIATGCRLVGQSTISPQPRNGAAHAPPPQRSRLTANGGVSMTPCSTPCPAGRRTEGWGQSRRASTPGAAGSTASGHRGCGVSAPDERKGIRRSKAAFARSSSRWGARHCRGKFVDAQKAVSCAALAGVRTLRSGRHFLTRDAALTGFENAIPHLRRSDSKAVMFPYQIRSSLDKDGYYVARTQFFYADEDVFFRLDGDPSIPSKGSPGTWEFELDELTDLGVRQEPERGDVPEDLICSRTIYDWDCPRLQPLPQLAQRLTVALIDGWLSWSARACACLTIRRSWHPWRHRARRLRCPLIRRAESTLMREASLRSSTAITAAGSSGAP